ncbi:MAG: hypothetical protein R6V41_07265 [Desulfobacteraceae bacterium]
MVNLVKSLAVPGILLICLPLAGALFKGANLSLYLEFPPKTHFTEHAPFSPRVFVLIALLVVITVFPFIKKALQFSRLRMPRSGQSGPFPVWGYAALVLVVVFWILAWTRFEWFSPFQPHTFFPLWLCFIILVNALVSKRGGSPPVLTAPGRFAALFLISAAFWWFFEYLNRFVQNWYYTGSDYPKLEYFFLATLSFSTVLPAVLSIRELLMTFSVFRKGFRNFPHLPGADSKPAALAVLLISGTGLFLLPFYPDRLFFLVWISPLLIILSLQALKGRPSILEGVKKGDYTLIVSYASAAFICGFFWEMWNFFSLSRWIYSVPYVHAFEIFEMPVLGYSGYLPFGLECAVIIQLFTSSRNTFSKYET